MADLTDVENALVNFAVSAVYPNGTSNPSIANVNIAVFAGWPKPADLDATLAAGNCYISVYPTQIENNTTRFPIDWITQSVDTPSITISIHNNQITLTGSISQTVPQTIIVVNNNVSYHYVVLTTDTINSVCTAIAALISGASASSNVITVTGSHKLQANVSVPGTAIQEVRRQTKVFQITIWAPTQSIRTTVASNLDVYLAQIQRFVLPDNYYAWLHYSHSIEIEKQEKQLCFRRDLFYKVEFATTVSVTDYTIADPFINSITPVSSIS